MPVLQIQRVNPLIDGDYPIEVESFTNRDVFTINEIAKVLPYDYFEQFQKGNVGLLVAFAVVALRNAGKRHDDEAVEALWNAKVGQIALVEEDDDSVPPAQGTTQTESNEKSNTSGPPSPQDSDGQDSDQNATGALSSDTSSGSDRETLAA